MSRRILAAGGSITLLAMAVIYPLLMQVYLFEIGPLLLIWGTLFVLPIYFYLPTVYALYKADKPMIVLWANVAGVTINLLLNVLFIRPTGL